MKRILCWDNKIIEDSKSINIVQHRPEKKNIALFCQDEWEGVYNGYASIIKIDGVYRMYYRADKCICVAHSTDGITFTKPNLGIYEFNGNKNNNIVFKSDRKSNKLDNFSVFYDQNPNCPADEKFKALSSLFENDTDILGYYASADGYHFNFVRVLDIKGTFDTFNVTFYDKKTEQYFLYYRNFHYPDGTDLKENEKLDAVNDIRDIRLSTSKDFVNWVDHGRLNYKGDNLDYNLYTNQIERYYRDQETFIGLPTRYVDRKLQKQNFRFMNNTDKRFSFVGEEERTASALTDCVVMTSSDGLTFNRRDEAFLTPGIQNDYNWWYGNCYTAYGLIETQAEDGAPNEISIFVGENYRIKKVDFRRYTIRLDGFFSWYANNNGGQVITKPFVLDGEKLTINFSTSVQGGVKISVLDQQDNAINGYESYLMFGDTIDRTVEFEKPLKDLKGKSVKLKIQLQDAHLYSLTID